MRNLGEFFGHIARGIRTDPSKPAHGKPAEKVVARETVEEETRETPQGPVVLRRTIIEEVQLPPHKATPPEV
jgi:hypothetical protein